MKPKKPDQPLARKEPIFYKTFPRFDEIRCYLKELAEMYPEMVRVERIGRSVEGRPIEMIIIQRNLYNPRDATMIAGGINAREWLSHTTVLYAIDYIINNPHMLNYTDYYIIPCANPDGYEYTHTHNRLWKKNMNKNESCEEENWGVDINRNFPFGYGLHESSACPSSFKYRGTGSFSEPESRSIRQAFTLYGQYVKLYIAMHCYGNAILYPWGYTRKHTHDESDLLLCGNEARRAMKCAFPDSEFKVGSLAKVISHSSGGSSDYARGVHKIKFSFTMKLRRGGESGFDPPPTEILRVGTETMVGIEAMVKHVRNYYASRKRKRSSTVCKRKRRKYSGDSSKYSLSLSDD